MPAPSEPYPPFLRRPSVRLQRALTRASKPALEHLSSRARLHTFNAPRSYLEQLHFLTEQFRGGGISSFHQREFLNIYHRTWQGLADQLVAQPDLFAGRRPPSHVIARRKGATVAVPILVEGAEDTVYVRDSDDQIAPGLIAAVCEAVLDTRASDAARIGFLARALYGNRIRLISDVDYELRVSGELLDDIPAAPSITEVCPWLRAMVAVALESLRGVELSRLPATVQRS